MHQATIKTRPAATAAMVASLIVALMLAFALLPQAAFGYFDRGPVGISLGSGSVSVAAGSSVNVSVALSPAQDAQTVGCGMAECPQTCGERGCLDANGQCVCAGTAYSTYYTQVQAASSNGAVATASYAGGSLTINGVGVGTATITLTASLRQHSNTSATVSVTVTAPAGGSGSGSGGGTGTGAGGSAGGSDGLPQSAPDGSAQTASEDASSAGQEVTVRSMMGTDIHLVRYSDATDVVGALRQIAGTPEEVTFWMGGTADRPSYSWTFKGESIDAAKLAQLESIDLGVDVSESGTGDVATLLKGGSAEKTLVLDFAHSGALPAPAVIYVAAPANIAATDALSLYYFDPAKGSFARKLDGLKAESGYIAFSIEHCSVWAVSASDLSRLGGAGQGGPMSGLGIAPFVIVGVLVLAVILMLVLVLRSRRATVAAAAAEAASAAAAVSAAETDALAVVASDEGAAAAAAAAAAVPAPDATDAAAGSAPASAAAAAAPAEPAAAPAAAAAPAPESASSTEPA